MTSMAEIDPYRLLGIEPKPDLTESEIKKVRESRVMGRGERRGDPPAVAVVRTCARSPLAFLPITRLRATRSPRAFLLESLANPPLT